MKNTLNEREEVLLAVTIVFGALFLATVLTLIIARYYKTLRSKWLSCTTRRSSTEDDLFAAIDTKRLSLDSKVPFMLSSRDEPQFTIPGTIFTEMIQPEGHVECNDKCTESASPAKEFVMKRNLTRLAYATVDKSGRDDVKEHQIIASHYLPTNPLMKRRPCIYNSEPSLLEADYEGTEDKSPSSNGSPGPFRRFLSVDSPDNPFTKRMRIKSCSSPTSSGTEDDIPNCVHHKQTWLHKLQPELYDKSRKKSEGAGTFGKIRINFQYLDQEKSKLELSLVKLDFLKIPTEKLGNIFVGIMMLPDRETMYQSKCHRAVESADFDEAFVFKKTQASGSFQAKTVRFIVYLRNDDSKNEVYGESTIQLAGREIFSKVRTNATLNINPPSHQTEIGDVLIEVVYTEKENLVILVKTMKLSPTAYVDNFSGLKIKCYLKNKGRRLKPNTKAVVPIPTKKENYISVNIELQQQIAESSFDRHSLHVVVSGKHRIMGKKIQIGKVVLGYGATNFAGNLNWRNVLTLKGQPLNLWHVVNAS